MTTEAVPSVLTDQAEAYADARVREALADLLNTLETREFDGGQRQIMKHIEALISRLHDSDMSSTEVQAPPGWVKPGPSSKRRREYCCGTDAR